MHRSSRAPQRAQDPPSVLLETGRPIVASLVLQRLTGLPVILVVIVGSALWAAWDSSKLGFSRHKGGNHPVILFLGIMALRLVGLPWYLAKRFQLRDGEAVRPSWVI